VEEFRRSGLTRREFARRHGINFWTLRNWLRRFPKEEPDKRADQDSLIELANPLAQQPSLASPSQYRVRMADGTTLELSSGFRREEVENLIDILRRQS